jgi:hypothetical protein
LRRDWAVEIFADNPIISSLVQIAIPQLQFQALFV